MAKYLISFGERFDDNKIVDGRKNLEAELLDLFNDCTFHEGEEPVIYELGKKLACKVETKIVVKGDEQ